MIYLIENPSARSGDTQRRVHNRLRRIFEAKRFSFRVFMTEGPGHARELAQMITSEKQKESAGDESDADTILAIGGDGTINEVIDGMEDLGRWKFGFLPSGSSNDFARGLGLPDLRSEGAIDFLVHCVTEGRIRRKLDVGWVNLDHRTDILSRLHPEVIPDRTRFIISSGVGFDAGICEEALNSRVKRTLNGFGLGRLTYGAIALRTLRSVYAHRIACDIEADGAHRLHLDHLLFATAFNLAYEGGGYRFAPQAVGDDGKLNMIAIGDLPANRILAAFPAAHKGSDAYLNNPGVHHFTFREATVRTSKPLWLHTSGEVSMKTDQVSFGIEKEQLRMII
jgi:YegS/Rv2252/BmrU family lipid kinase